LKEESEPISEKSTLRQNQVGSETIRGVEVGIQRKGSLTEANSTRLVEGKKRKECTKPRRKGKKERMTVKTES
jgi:hypothetical protein